MPQRGHAPAPDSGLRGPMADLSTDCHLEAGLRPIRVQGVGELGLLRSERPVGHADAVGGEWEIVRRLVMPDGLARSRPNAVTQRRQQPRRIGTAPGSATYRRTGRRRPEQPPPPPDAVVETRVASSNHAFIASLEQIPASRRGRGVMLLVGPMTFARPSSGGLRRGHRPGAGKDLGVPSWPAGIEAIAWAPCS